MNTETLRRQWKTGKTTFNTFLNIPSSWTAELMAHAGWETLTIDMQHGLADFNTMLSMLQAMAATDTIPFIRLPWNEPPVIMKVLDAGAMGLICPMISTAEDVERFVAACRYPPRGIRSFGPIRARLYAEGEDYARFADENILTFAMIETAAAADNLSDIAAVDGLDGLFIGPWDLSVSLGLKKVADFDDPKLRQVLEAVLNVCREHELVPGIFTLDVPNATRMAEMGFQFVTCGNDNRMLEEMSRRRVGELKGA